MKLQILKKDNYRLESFDGSKIVRAVNLASERVAKRLSEEEMDMLVISVKDRLDEGVIPVKDLHLIIIEELKKVDLEIGKSYEDYRGYKANFNKTFSRMLSATQDVLDNGDKENANKNSNLVSTKKELVSGIISKHLALDYELPPKISTAHKEGYIHIHDLTDEIYGSFNCCLFDMKNVLKDGFTLNGISLREPKHIETALSVISDIILASSSNQFGGHTTPEIDTVLVPYVKNTIERVKSEFSELIDMNEDELHQLALDRVYRILEHGFENLFDHRLNLVNNSNGQTSFTTLTFGLETSEEGRLVSKAILNARIKGIGKDRITAIFPKLVFLHRQEINGEEGTPNYDIKELALDCSMTRMYPDFLSLDEGYLKEMYDKYKQVVSPMGL